uniref:Uncharacterized protein n=1 Tax=Panagrolaimus superbus TaxID=310955 RepID=A0A914YYU1_9BILA
MIRLTAMTTLKIILFLIGFIGIESTFISVHGSITCCEKPQISCNYPSSATVTINEWPHRILISSDYTSDSSYQISWNHNEYFIDPFIEIKVECSFGDAIVKEKLPIFGGIIQKDFEITNSEY